MGRQVSTRTAIFLTRTRLPSSLPAPLNAARNRCSAGEILWLQSMAAAYQKNRLVFVRLVAERCLNIYSKERFQESKLSNSKAATRGGGSLERRHVHDLSDERGHFFYRLGVRVHYFKHRFSKFL